MEPHRGFFAINTCTRAWSCNEGGEYAQQRSLLLMWDSFALLIYHTPTPAHPGVHTVHIFNTVPRSPVLIASITCWSLLRASSQRKEHCSVHVQCSATSALLDISITST